MSEMVRRRRGFFGADERGVSAVEFAMLSPLFFLLLFAIIEGGIVLWTKSALQHGAEMAARCASVNTTLCGSTAAVQNYASQQAYGLNPAPETFSVSSAACGYLVTASYNFSYAVPMLGTTIILTARSCFP
jgi:Flp pilus assembly protein TadG